MQLSKACGGYWYPGMGTQMRFVEFDEPRTGTCWYPDEILDHAASSHVQYQTVENREHPLSPRTGLQTSTIARFLAVLYWSVG